MIELTQLRFAVIAGEQGSFNRASALTRTKQTTISRQIAHLEDRLGFRVFERSRRGIVTTAAGETLLGEARRILRDVERLPVRGRRAEQGERLRIGYRSALSAGPLHRLLNSFRSEHPSIPIEPVEDSDDALVQGVRSGDLDLAIAPGSVRDADLDAFTVWHEQVFVGMAPDHPLVERPQLTWPDVFDHVVTLTSQDASEALAREARTAAQAWRRSATVQLVAVGRDNLADTMSASSVTLLTESALGRPGQLMHRALHDRGGPVTLASTLLRRPDAASASGLRLLAILRRLHPGFGLD